MYPVAYQARQRDSATHQALRHPDHALTTAESL